MKAPGKMHLPDSTGIPLCGARVDPARIMPHNVVLDEPWHDAQCNNCNRVLQKMLQAAKALERLEESGN